MTSEERARALLNGCRNERLEAIAGGPIWTEAKVVGLIAALLDERDRLETVARVLRAERDEILRDLAERA